MSKETTPHELLEIIQNQAFKDVDLSQVLTMSDEQLCTFSLEQMERLRATRGSIAALWLSDQFLTADRELLLMYNPHPWLDLAIEMKLPSQLPDLSDDEYRIAEWIFQLALLVIQQGLLIIQQGLFIGQFFLLGKDDQSLLGKLFFLRLVLCLCL